MTASVSATCPTSMSVSSPGLCSLAGVVAHMRCELGAILADVVVHPLARFGGQALDVRRGDVPSYLVGQLEPLKASAQETMSARNARKANRCIHRGRSARGGGHDGHGIMCPTLLQTQKRRCVCVCAAFECEGLPAAAETGRRPVSRSDDGGVQAPMPGASRILAAVAERDRRFAGVGHRGTSSRKVLRTNRSQWISGSSSGASRATGLVLHNVKIYPGSCQHVHTYTRAHRHIHTNVHMYTCTHIRIYEHMIINISTYTRLHTHRHIGT